MTHTEVKFTEVQNKYTQGGAGLEGLRAVCLWNQMFQLKMIYVKAEKRGKRERAATQLLLLETGFPAVSGAPVGALLVT